MILPQVKFAKLCGVSRQSISKLIKRGGLVARPDGKLDTDNIINQDYINKHKEKAALLDSEPKNNKTNNNDSIKDCNAVQNEQSIMDEYANICTKNDLETQKTMAQIMQIQVRTARERGELIDRDLVKKVFAKLFTIDTGELKTFGSKVAPEIASILGVSSSDGILKVKKCIDLKMNTILKHVQRVYTDSLKEMEKNVCQQ